MFEGLSLSSDRSDFSKSLQSQVSSAISSGVSFAGNSARAYSTALGNTVKTRASYSLESGIKKAFGNKNFLAQYAGREVGNLARSAMNGIVDPAISGIFNSPDNAISALKGLFGSGEGQSLFSGMSDSNPSSRRTTLTEMQDRKDPLLSIDWVAFIRDKGVEPIESIYIDSIQLPSIRIEQTSVYRDGISLNYAGGVSVDNCTVNLFNDRTGKALKLASSWLNAVYDFQTGNYGSPNDYKKDITVFLLTVKGEIVCTIELIGCFPSSFNSLSLTNSSSELLPVVLDLSVDTMYLSGA